MANGNELEKPLFSGAGAEFGLIEAWQDEAGGPHNRSAGGVALFERIRYAGAAMNRRIKPPG